MQLIIFLYFFFFFFFGVSEFYCIELLCVDITVTQGRVLSNNKKNKKYGSIILCFFSVRVSKSMAIFMSLEIKKENHISLHDMNFVKSTNPKTYIFFPVLFLNSINVQVSIVMSLANVFSWSFPILAPLARLNLSLDLHLHCPMGFVWFQFHNRQISKFVPLHLLNFV